MKKILAIIFLLLANISISNAQNEILTTNQIKEDTKIFITALQEVHPGLHLHNTPVEINQMFNQLKEQDNNLTLKEYYSSLLHVIANIGDGHTDLHEGKLFRQLYDYLEKTLPFEFYIIDNRLYISKNYSNNKEIPIYSEVLFINDVNTKDIIEKLYLLTPADGNRETFKERYNEKIFGRLYSKLINTSEEYDLVFKYPNSNNSTPHTVKGIKDEVIHPNKYDKTPLAFEMNKKDNLAILTVNTFQYRLMLQKKIDFHSFLKKTFKTIRKNKIEHLIIDIRENYGGDNILAVTLYSYLIEGNFKAMDHSITKLNNATSIASFSNFPNGNYPFLKRYDIIDLGDGSFKLENGIDSKNTYNSNYIYKGPKSKPENISKNKFKGQVYCLTSGLTFSAAANFASLLDRHENVIFIGQETGGTKGEFCGGGFYQVTLPNSQFVLQIPYMKRSVADLTTNNKNGILPDHPIKRQNKSLNNNDLELKKAIEIITKVNSKNNK